jgi:hypothetical protein
MLRFICAIMAVASALAPAIAEAGRCTGGTPCYACTKCSTCKHCKSGGSCGACNGGNQKEKQGGKKERPAPMEPEPMCTAGRETAVPRPARREAEVDLGSLDGETASPFRGARPRAVMAPEPDELPGVGRQFKPPRTTARTAARSVAARAAPAADDEKRIRDWKAADGTVLASGRFLSLVQKTLWIKTREGKRVKLSLDEISEADARYLENRKWE